MSIQIASWLKVVSLSIILSFGIQFVQAWTSPNTTPPGGNVSGPITTGSTAQTKNGPLTVSGVLKSNAGGFLNQGVLTTGNVSLNSWGSWLVLGDVNSSWNSWHNVNLQSGLIYADAIISPTFCLNSIGNLSNCITSWPSGGGGGGGDMTGVLAGTGLTGGGLTGDVTLSVDTNLVATKAYVDGMLTKVFSGHNVKPAQCDGTPSGGGLCNGKYYVDITFPSPFSKVPDVIVTPESVSDQGGCVGFATDQVRAFPSNITKNGFRLYANGSVVGSGCGATYEGWATYATAGWMAIGN